MTIKQVNKELCWAWKALEQRCQNPNYAARHEMLEWLVPVKERLENTQISEFSTGELLCFIDVIDALDKLEVALSELDRIADIQKENSHAKL